MITENMNCESCAFRNLKGTATAVIMRDGKTLLLKRNQEPFLGDWDLPGGYINEGETPEDAICREIKEELGVSIVGITPIKTFPGIAYWNNKDFPIISHAFLVEISGDIRLDNENTAYCWEEPRAVKKTVAFDSNKNIMEFVDDKFSISFPEVKELVKQLDSSARIQEYNYYQAVLDGYVAKEYDGNKLIGMGWIFPRRTLLRKQAVIEDMIVDEKYRGQGLGKKILLDLLRWAKENGVEMVELTSGSHRMAANELYKKVGFQLHPTNHYLLKL